MITVQGFNGATLLIMIVLIGFAVFGRKVLP